MLPGGAFLVDLAEAAPSEMPEDAVELGSTRMAQAVALQLISQLQGSKDAPMLRAELGWAAMEQWLCTLNHHRQLVLIILENAECMQGNKAFKQMLQTLQELPSMKLLITSRAANFDITTHLYVPRLSETAALQLLGSACPVPADWDARAAAEVARLCGGNAQLVSIITGMLRAGRCTLQDAAHHPADPEQPELLSAAAVDVYREIMVIQQRRLGLEDPETLDCMEKTADLLADSHETYGEEQEALALMREVLATREQLLGPAHEDTLRVSLSQHWLECTGRKLGSTRSVAVLPTRIAMIELQSSNTR
ncbi:hypothetical protein WJX72_008003 [[Myrmecia] bisecta]|uniref:Kinesin light chain n=1 Tax=[Myrmecia] bisecta TaxID=41462 RepID=A0AAW1PSS8_9CHLO